MLLCLGKTYVICLQKLQKTRTSLTFFRRPGAATALLADRNLSTQVQNVQNVIVRFCALYSAAPH